MFGKAVAAVRAAVEALKSEDLDSASDQALEEDFGDLQKAAEELNAERLRRLAALDRRRPYERDGFLSTSSWVAQRFSVSHSVAAGDVRFARALEAMPKSREALCSGEISSSAARVLVGAREGDHEAFAESETLLVDAARRHSVRDLQRAVAYWRSAAESRRDPEDREEGMRERRRLHVSSTAFGLVRIDGDLDPETGGAVLTALRSVVDAELRSPDPEDRRTPAQRRTDALGEICRHWLDDPDRPAVRSDRPHVTVVMDVATLRGERGSRSEFENVGPISPDTARQWACDAAVIRVLTMGESEPLDVGRKTPVVPASIRRAVIVRDRGCRFPGCDRPASWCDCHHVVHWADGGRTAKGNLVLLCRRHHRLVHRGFAVEMKDGTPVFRRPDGTILEDRWPPWRNPPIVVGRRPGEPEAGDRLEWERAG